ncbi:MULTISPECIES: hypothetical protein [Sphingobacterium]|uniref:hypothetical protein n=1 Tax=Sphingobacterium TaxID=28453 RepID=UPI0013E51A93|nr:MULTISPECIES: hypothetical protein [Sphingobacterium]QIH36032.1 hypothetical protein G6053_25535 [Sphingobacterium sp. DR205]
MMTKKTLLFSLFLISIAFAQQKAAVTANATGQQNIVGSPENTAGKTILQSSNRKMTLLPTP